MQAVSLRPPRCPAATCGASLCGLESWLLVVAFLESCEALSKDSAALASASSTLARTLGDEAAWREAVLERARCAGAEELRFEGTWRRTFLCIHQREAGCSATTLQWSCRCGVLWSCAPRKRADPKVLKKVRNWIEGVSAWVCPEQPCHFQEVQLGHFFAGWPGAWTPWRLRKTFGPRRFRVALPGAGEVYRMELDHFLRYAFESSISDSQPPRWDAEPLYLFDPKPPLALRPLRQPQLSTQLDLARERGCPVAEALRKLARGWLLIGGPGSGSRFHVDAFGTGAWSATLCGAKRWALYPPGRRPPGLLDMGPGRFAAPAPIFWFSEAGDLLYIPPNWWHSVLNLTVTVAFTRNVAYGDLAADPLLGSLAEAKRSGRHRCKSSAPHSWFQAYFRDRKDASRVVRYQSSWRSFRRSDVPPTDPGVVHMAWSVMPESGGAEGSGRWPKRWPNGGAEEKVSIRQIGQAVLASGEKGQALTVERQEAQATVLTSCLPYLIIICLSSYVVGFVAILVMDTCWTRVIELDYGALGMNVVTFIGIFKKVMSDAKFRSKISDQHLALIFYLPWICITALQNWGYRCGHETSTLTAVQCCSRRNMKNNKRSSEQLADQVGLEMFFLCLVGLGASASAQSLVAWSLTNAKRAEEAMSALAAARQDLLETWRQQDQLFYDLMATTHLKGQNGLRQKRAAKPKVTSWPWHWAGQALPAPGTPEGVNHLNHLDGAMTAVDYVPEKEAVILLFKGLKGRQNEHLEQLASGCMTCAMYDAEARGACVLERAKLSNEHQRQMLIGTGQSLEPDTIKDVLLFLMART
ncbi:unnamed protein product [Durusdinium trenchii]|uniref:JmjC domain-containing protein n=1 Tax=Durusdinium trenchii TaxID=1381693 RepID=A0ABP0QD29_9DINO